MSFLILSSVSVLLGGTVDFLRIEVVCLAPPPFFTPCLLRSWLPPAGVVAPPAGCTSLPVSGVLPSFTACTLLLGAGDLTPAPPCTLLLGAGDLTPAPAGTKCVFSRTRGKVYVTFISLLVFLKKVFRSR